MIRGSWKGKGSNLRPWSSSNTRRHYLDQFGWVEGRTSKPYRGRKSGCGQGQVDDREDQDVALAVVAAELFNATGDLW